MNEIVRSAQKFLVWTERFTRFDEDGKNYTFVRFITHKIFTTFMVLSWLFKEMGAFSVFLFFILCIDLRSKRLV